jgi:hypothetical protein
MNVEIGAEAALFPEKEYISGIFVAVHTHSPLTQYFSIRDTVKLSRRCSICHKPFSYFSEYIDVPFIEPVSPHAVSLLTNKKIPVTQLP